ncbi:hypothetical protein BB561_004020 [Smittium simulii]|uniref:Mitochondrial DNA polymerase catalytic subunit n=1 Tax=Smittium simulii TaxID=133385 RepID=A0A2T9YII0_9FUNG|nr:hypothetical protein BB561_004020 [Smittium simulii]
MICANSFNYFRLKIATSKNYLSLNKAKLLVSLASKYSTYKTCNDFGVQLLPLGLHNNIFKENPDSIQPSHTLPTKPSPKKKNIQILRYAAKPIQKPSQPDPVSSDNTPDPLNSDLLDISLTHLKKNDLLFDKTSQYDSRYDQIDPDISKILGKNIEEHFKKISSFRFNTFFDLAQKITDYNHFPKKPAKSVYIKKSGWVKYSVNPITNSFDVEPVPGITDSLMFFDVETMPAFENFPFIAVAMTLDSWYVWMSPYLVGDSNNFRHLIQVSPPSFSQPNVSSNFNTPENISTLDSKNASPLASILEPNQKLIIGHNIGFDRAKIYEEYRIKESDYQYIDTMSLHIASHGLCSQQRLLFNKITKMSDDSELDNIVGDTYYDPTNKFTLVSSTNSLKAIAQFYLDIDIDKNKRDVFVSGTVSEIRQDLSSYVDYCANDVDITAKLFQTLFKNFVKQCPHPASFAGMLLMSSSFLTVVPDKWNKFIDSAEAHVESLRYNLEKKLLEIARQQSNIENPQDNPWLNKLDWNKSYITIKKKKKPVQKSKSKQYKDTINQNNNIPIEPKQDDIEETVTVYSKSYLAKISQNPELENKPNWFIELWDSQKREFKLTSRSRITPYLINLCWNGFPVHFVKNYGWTYYVPKKLLVNPKTPVLVSISKITPLKFQNKYKSSHIILSNQNDEPDESAQLELDKYNYYKIPHKDGEDYNVGNALSKEYFYAIENGLLTSPFGIEKEAIESSIMGSYWLSARDRIKSQTVVPIKNNQDDDIHSSEIKYDYDPDTNKTGVILPMVIPMGTITRRGVEATWATASNAKINRIGSELKSLIEAPAGYKFVGADVDSEELWISSLLGDAQFGMHGSTALGYMCLLGSKANGNDMHSNTAKILGVDRNYAKVFNYSRIYGAGIKHASSLLMQANPLISKNEANRSAFLLYLKTKGIQSRDSKINKKLGFKGKLGYFWYGGSESYMFNVLEQIACSVDPRTPVLNCGIAAGLQEKNAGNMFMTSRINWVVQSSGVDYLHLLLVSMDYLTRKYQIDARFMVSVHDEVRYMCADEDVLRCSLALQISNLWVRSMFSYKLGFDNLPASVAFFSTVDIDFVLRKEANLDCVTPSNTTPLEHGESLDIFEILEYTNGKLGRENCDDYNPTLINPAEIDESKLESDKVSSSYYSDLKAHKKKKISKELLIKLKAQMASSKYELESLLGEIENHKQYTYAAKQITNRNKNLIINKQS